MGKRSERRARWAETTAREQADRDARRQSSPSMPSSDGGTVTQEELDDLNRWLATFHKQHGRVATLDEAMNYIRGRRLRELKMRDPEMFAEVTAFAGMRPARIAFPECSKTCEVLSLLGAGECESICPEKFGGGYK